MSSIPRSRGMWILAWVAFLLGQGAVGWGGDNISPPLTHRVEGPPRVKYRHDAPRPVCPPCNSPFFGYYPTCWNPWPAGWANCPCMDPPWVPLPVSPGYSPQPAPAYPQTIRPEESPLPRPQAQPTPTDGPELQPTSQTLRKLIPDSRPRLGYEPIPAGR